MSKTKLRNAIYSVKKLIDNSNIKSYKTKYDTKVILNRSLKDLQSIGFKMDSIKSLKPKHIEGLVKLWTEQNKSSATIKNYMAKLRMACRLIGKHDIIQKGNKAYNIADRTYNNVNKAIQADFEKVKNSYINYSLKLQEAFGLRREEAIKFDANFVKI